MHAQLVPRVSTGQTQPHVAQHAAITYPVRPAAAAATAHQQPVPGATEHQQQLQAIRLVQQHGLDVDAGVVAQEAASTYSHLQQSSPGTLSEQLLCPADLVARALQLSDLLATGSTYRTLHMLKRHPNLLRLAPDQVAAKVLQLKMLMPAANIAELLYQKPSLLLLDDIPGTLTPALNKLHALMPGIPVEGKLHEGGTVFWSFASLLEGSSKQLEGSSNKAATAGARRSV